MGDVLARRRPNSGRIMLSQISSASAIPLAAVLLLGLPYDSSTAAVHGLVFFVMGLFMSWNAAATNKYVGFLNELMSLKCHFIFVSEVYIFCRLTLKKKKLQNSSFYRILTITVLLQSNICGDSTGESSNEHLCVG